MELNKFKIGQRVRVIKRISSWNYGSPTEWVYIMDKTIGKEFTIITINSRIGIRLNTSNNTKYGYDYWYPEESLALIGNYQLLFDFM